MLPVNCGSHTDYQNFGVTNLRKYYPTPDVLAHSTWNIIRHDHSGFREIILSIMA